MSVDIIIIGIHIMLTGRQIQIIQMLLQNSGTLTNREMAASLHVSQRTVRNDISQINLEAIKNHIQIHSGGNGYFLAASDRQGFLNLVRSGDTYANMYESSRTRQLYMIFQLLWIDIPVTINELADTMFCSRTTVSKDISEIKGMFGKTDGLRLETGREGILLAGEEEEKRNYIGKLFLEIYERGEIQSVRSLLSKLGIIKDDDFFWLYDFFIVSFGKMKYILSDRGMYLFTLENLVFFNRISMGFLVEEQSADSILLNLQYEKLEDHFKITIGRNERAYFGNQVASRCQISVQQKKVPFAGEIIKDFIRELSDIFKIDEKILRQYQDGLVSHLVSMIERLDQKITLDSSVINEVKNQYLYAFECSTAIIPIIQKYMKRSLSETEISYIAVHLAVVLEHEKRPVNIVVFCASGMSTSMLVTTKLLRYFGNRIHIIGTFPQYQAKMVFESYPGIDIAVSTIPFEKEIPVPLIQISPLMTSYDVRKLDRILAQKEHGECRKEEDISLRKEMFFVFENGETNEEILKIMAGSFSENGYIEDAEEFFRSVKEREELYSTLYGNIWLPHPLHSYALKNGISAGLIRAREKCTVVFMLCIKKEDTALFNAFYDRIMLLLDNRQFFADLCVSRNFEEFQECFSKCSIKE